MGNRELGKLDDEFRKEGFEDNAAVRIGNRGQTREQSLAMAEDVINEGRTKDLATYLHLNKRVFVPNSYIAENAEKYRFPIDILVPGNYFGGGRKDGKFRLTYVDKDRNICFVEIDPGKIERYGKGASAKPDTEGWSGTADWINQDLRDLGFRYIESGGIWSINGMERHFMEDQRGKEEKSGKAGFDF